MCVYQIKSVLVSVKCIRCNSEIDLVRDFSPTEIVSCPTCGQEYEVQFIGDDIKYRLVNQFTEAFEE